MSLLLTGAGTSGEIVITGVPENLVAPALDNTAPRIGQTVTCGPGSWSNSPTSAAYQWKRDGVNIAGQTSSSHVVVTADIGKVLTCAVTAHNADGNSTPELSNATDAILSNDTSLSVFSVEGNNVVDGGSLELDATYIGAVIGDLTIVATKTNAAATVGTKTITPSPLLVGDNSLDFDVLAPDGVTTQHYNVTLTVLIGI